MLMGRRNKVSNFVDPEADATDCHECGEAIQIADEEDVMDAILRHYRNVHDIPTTDE